MKKGKILTIICIIAISLLLCGMMRPKAEVIGYEYRTGTSLWDLASDCPDTMDKRDAIAEIQRLNGMKDSTVYPHQVYQVPMYKED